MVHAVTTHQPQGPGEAVEIHVVVPRGTEHQVPRWQQATRVSLDVLGYKGAHPTFPDESTADQFFDETQFESYRALGYDVASAALIAPRTQSN